ncbi:MoxR family ATPase [bacterium]|nr:MoxR family ATPase [bacterium]
MSDNPSKSSDAHLLQSLCDARETLSSQIAKKIIGQQKIIDNLLIALFARGHCLLIGVPGLAKTLLISTLAQALDMKFNRIQFTPDLMPSDITGTEILEEDRSTGQKYFRFIKGPVFSQILLADEINRTPPKTQAALLQAMQEYQVSAAGETHILDKPFFVLATQNPIEQEGTYPLPEAQLDRFFFSLWIDYPQRDEEVQIVSSTTKEETAAVKAVLNGETIVRLQELVRRIPVAQPVVEYAVDLVRKTRPHEHNTPAFIRKGIRWGAGPRAAQSLILAAKSRAALNGRGTPDIDDVREAAIPVLRHRLVLTFSAEADGMSAVDMVNNLLSTT